MALAIQPAPDWTWDRISAEEREARENLAALFRFTALQGWDDHILTHITVRAPDNDAEMLANPLGFRFSEITPMPRSSSTAPAGTPPISSSCQRTSLPSACRPMRPS